MQRVIISTIIQTASHAGHLRASRLTCAATSHQRDDGHGREIRVTCAPESPNIPRLDGME